MLKCFALSNEVRVSQSNFQMVHHKNKIHTNKAYVGKCSQWVNLGEECMGTILSTFFCRPGNFQSKLGENSPMVSFWNFFSLNKKQHFIHRVMLIHM